MVEFKNIYKKAASTTFTLLRLISIRERRTIWTLIKTWSVSYLLLNPYLFKLYLFENCISNTLVKTI